MVTPEQRQQAAEILGIGLQYGYKVGAAIVAELSDTEVKMLVSANKQTINDRMQTILKHLRLRCQVGEIDCKGPAPSEGAKEATADAETPAS